MWSLRLQGALILTCAAIVFARDFGYGRVHGPQHWAEDYGRCNGKHQSPINIDKLHVIKLSYPDIKYTNFDAEPKAVHLANNGHTVLVTISYEEGKVPRMSGGPLNNASSSTDYQFEQFHFHWGDNDTVGSEDTIDNHRYPAEMHVVMRSLAYKDFNSALGQEYGIAVLAFFFKLDEHKLNHNYGEFVESLVDINKKGKSKDLAEPLPLMKFLSANSSNYYSYIGSLTTPPCAEKVIWIDYQEPIYISDYQLDRFRELAGNDEDMRNNFRPIQPLNDRVIHENIPNSNRNGESWMSLSNGVACTEFGFVVIALGCSLAMLLMHNILGDFN